MKKTFKFILIVLSLLLLCTGCNISQSNETDNNSVNSEQQKYEEAISLIEEDDYISAKNILLELSTTDEIQDRIKLCNHMILYTHILENGEAYRDSYIINNPDTGLSLQVKESDTTIRMFYEYYIDSSSFQDCYLIISQETDNIEVAYYLETGSYSTNGEGVFYPKLYDGNLDNTTEETPADAIAIKISEDTTIWIDDVNYSPYMKLDYYNSSFEFLDEIAALQFYCIFEEVLSLLSDHLAYVDCGVTLSDLGIVLEK